MAFFNKLSQSARNAAGSLSNIRVAAPIRHKASASAAAPKLVPDEYDGPLMRTELPGPKSQELLKKMDSITRVCTYYLLGNVFTISKCRFPNFHCV
eukprot:XP_011679375.1 PREDICTED: 4-aminobutyrate aminotransferase, mitochondrial-like [Strongylocentrotus purpuratus]